MRALLVSQFFAPEPMSIVGPGLVGALNRSGFDIDVLTGFPNYPGGRIYDGHSIRPWKRESRQDFTVTRVPLFPSRSGNPIGRIANYGSFAVSSALLGPLLLRRPDVVYVYLSPATAAVGPALWRAIGGIPYVLHVQDLWPESVTGSEMLRGAGARLAEHFLSSNLKRLYRNAGAVVAQSPRMMALLLERGAPVTKTSYIYNWADESAVCDVPTSEAEHEIDLLAQLGFQGRFTLLYAGNLGFVQGLESAIRAASLLVDDPRFRLALAGSGPAEASLRELAMQLGCTNVDFLGRFPPEEIGQLYAAADATLIQLKDLPLFEATIPSKTQAALRYGRPIIVAVGGDAADLVEAAGAGFRAIPGDPRDLAASIRRMMMASAEERSAMGRRGRDFYNRTISTEIGAVRLAGILAQVARGGSNN